jgi:hypothetical protein
VDEIIRILPEAFFRNLKHISKAWSQDAHLM